MRRLLLASTLCLVACAHEAPAPAAPPPAQQSVPAATPAAQPEPKPEPLAADTPETTTEGATFNAPTGWTVRTTGAVTHVAAPEEGSQIALVDVHAADADAAVAAAWAAYKPDHKWPFRVATAEPDKNGWTDRKGYSYQTDPNERRDVGVDTMRANGVWTVAIFDMSQSVAEKRLGQVRLIFEKLYPKGYTEESFAGKKAHPLDKARLDELRAWVEKARIALQVPGVSVGIIQDGKVVMSEGFGERELGKKTRPDGDTLYMIASNTKALTTLMLAKLVDQKKISWDEPVTTLLPSFKLGDADTTSKVEVKHLICACTGLPRQDLEWLFEFQHNTPETAMATLGTMQPTSKFGEMFQYSNPMAGAGGFTGGHVLYPKLELGAAYDEAMKTQVFQPLGMKATTFDYAKALKGNHATAHSNDVDGKTQLAEMEINYSIIPLRPAGAAWSSVNDVLKYVQMELNNGALPNGKPYISKEALLERRAPQVPIGKDITYGMGLTVSHRWHVDVVHHGGDMVGYHSDMMWLPDQGVGAVVLTNADPGWLLRSQFLRKLLEVLFDGRNEAEPDVLAQAKQYFDEVAADRKLFTVPADAAAAARLAHRYANPALGEIVVSTAGADTVFDFGEWKSKVASRLNKDGTVTFITIAPGAQGFEFTVGAGDKRTLLIRDAQHEYTFTEG